MGRTEIPSHQVKDGGITRADLNTMTANYAVITKILSGASTGVLVKTSTGADAGTGDVTLEADITYLNTLYPNVTVSRAQNLFLATPASGGAGAASFRNISVSDVPILNQNTTGSAGSAPAGSLTGTSLASNVVSSSLTTVGTLANLTVTNTIGGSINGNAATATTLQNARTINGVSFNGSADITVTAAAGTLTGTVLKSTVVSSSLTSVGTLTSLSVSGAISGASLTATGAVTAGSVNLNAAYAKALFTGGTYTAEIYSDGANLIIANDQMIYLQSVAGAVLYAKGQKSGSDTWFEMMYNGSTRAKTVFGGFSVTGCGYFSNGIEVTGDVKATGDGYFFNSVSDMRLKKDFERMTPDYGIGIVRKTNPYWFTWLTGKKEGQRDFGFGAQEMEKILPEMVMNRPDGSLGLYYEHYTAILASAVQYLDERVIRLTNELEALKNAQ